jgi:AbrB family looped-hinge helix DNA binding protein
MPLATLKTKGQITIPAALREKLDVAQGDVFDVEVVDGKVVMTPQELVPKTRKRPAGKSGKQSLTRWLGAAKGVYCSPKDVDS